MYFAFRPCARGARALSMPLRFAKVLLMLTALAGCRKAPAPRDVAGELRRAEAVRARLSELLAAMPEEADLAADRPCDDEALGRGLTGDGLEVAHLYEGGLRVAVSGKKAAADDELETAWHVALTKASFSRLVDYPKIDVDHAIDWDIRGDQLAKEPLVAVIRVQYANVGSASIGNVLNGPADTPRFDGGTARGVVVVFDYRSGGPRCWVKVAAQNSDKVFGPDMDRSVRQDLVHNFAKAAREGLVKITKVAHPNRDFGTL
jgi:hypothetical protein